MSQSSLLQKHMAFWRCDAVERPLVSISRWTDRSADDFDWGLPHHEGLLEPDMLQVERLLPEYDRLFGGGGVYDGQLLWTAAPPRAIPWIEGILGCPIRYALPRGGFAAEPVVPDWPALSDPGAMSANPWLNKLGEIIDALAALANGRFPVAVPLLRGPWVLVSALRGQENTYYDVYGDPESLADLATACAQIWIDVNEYVASRIPLWEGGYVGYYGVWAPAFAATTQNDCSVSVSPSTYGNLMLPADQVTIERWEYGLFHLHSAGLHQLDHVLGQLHGRAVNVTIDPSGPSLEELLPILERVQDQHVPLHVLVFSRDHARLVEQCLQPHGLAILCWPTH